MAENNKGWGWFEKFDKDQSSENTDIGQNPDIAATYARCFVGDDGQTVLRHLRSLTLDRTLGPRSSDSLLRHMEGQRQLVAQIHALIENGRLAKR